MATMEPNRAISGDQAAPPSTDVQITNILLALAPTLAQLNASIEAARNRKTQFGNTPAANVELLSGELLQVRMDRLDTQLANLGSNGLTLVTQPAAPSGTTAPNGTLTPDNGAWSLTPDSYKYAWYRFTPAAGFIYTNWTGATYPESAADVGYQIAVLVSPVKSGITSPGAYSVLTATITATLPTNSGGANSPTASPSGSQPINTDIGWLPGTWANATGGVFTAQPVVGGTAYGPEIALGTTFRPIDGMQGLGLKFLVYCTTAQGRSLGASTNTITITGIPVLTKASGPAFTDPVRVGVPNALTNAGWSGGTIDVGSRKTRIFVVEGYGGLNTPYAVINGDPVTPGAPITYTPEVDGNSFLKSATEGPNGLPAGLASLVGKTVAFDQTVTYLGVLYQSDKSVGKVVLAPVSTLTAVQNATSISAQAGSAISAIAPVTATGGSGVKSAAISPTPPSWLTFDITTGVFGGTPPAGTTSNVTYTVTWSDTGGSTPVALQVTLTVTTATVSALPFLPFPGSVLLVNNSGGGLTIVTLNGKQRSKQRIVNANFPAFNEVRCEQYWPNSSGASSMAPGSDNWWAYTYSNDTVEFPPPDDSAHVLQQVHTRGQGDTQPDVYFGISAEANELRWRVAFNTHPAPQWNYNGGPYPDTEGTSLRHAEAIPTPGVPYSYIVHYRPGYLTAHNPVYEVWRSKNGAAPELLFSYTGFNTYNVEGANTTYSYLRMGPYKHTGSDWTRAALTFYYSPMAYGQGTNLYPNALVALGI